MPIIEPSVPLQGQVHPALWSAVIPAAGRGTRLAAPMPKILYPVLSRPILDWLLDIVAPVCGAVVLVLAPKAAAEVEGVARKRLGDRVAVAIQDEPRGMADAIRRGLEKVATPNTLVIWGDQILLKAETVRRCILAHQMHDNTVLTLATVLRDHPYIDIRRDESGRIAEVRQAREGDACGEQGESDCGLFLFNTAALRETLVRAEQAGLGRGAKTGEFNLLQILPLFEGGTRRTTAVRVEDPAEAIGINNPAEATDAERILSQRQRV